MPTAKPKSDQEAILKTFVEEFVDISPGEGKFPASFEMGHADGPESERPVRKITLTKPFAIAKYEVPQNLYGTVMQNNPSRWKGPRNSAETMNWLEAVVFCQRVTEMLRSKKLIEQDEEIRLPTEAEWEYCCRAGTETKYSFGDVATEKGDKEKKASRLDPFAWHTGNAAGNDPEVGVLKPNPWGLYDMHGYLWEFTADAWHPSHQDSPADGTARKAADHGILYVIRGGSWRDHYTSLQCSTRQPLPNHARSDAIGFRCVKAKVTR